MIGLDMGVKHDATVAAICHAERVPGRRASPRRPRPDAGWTPLPARPVRLQVVEEWVEEATRRYNRARVRFDPCQALHLRKG